MITGSLYKFALGPKGMISGAFFGCLIGTFGGCCIYILTKLTGIKMDDAYNLAKSYFVYKDRALHGAMKVCILEKRNSFLNSINNLLQILYKITNEIIYFIRSTYFTDAA